MTKNRCKHCNISTELFFCPNCGLVLRYPQFLEGEKKQKDRLQLYIKDIVQKALSAKVTVSTLADKEVLTNSVLSTFNEHILLLQEAYGNITAKSNDESQSIIRLLRDLADKSKAPDCHLVVSGKIGAGKSTFLKILSGEVDSTSGEVIIGKGERLSVLLQNHNAYDEYSVIDTVIMGDKELYDINKNISDRLVNWEKGNSVVNDALERIYGSNASKISDLSPELASANKAYSDLMNFQKNDGINQFFSFYF